MKMPQSHVKSLRDRLGSVSNCVERYLWDSEITLSLADVLAGTTLGGCLSELSGRSVLIATRDQMATALALIELDGVARRLTICPSDLAYEYFPSIVTSAEVDVIVSDTDELDRPGIGAKVCVTSKVVTAPAERLQRNCCATEWVILTSGTTGAPKLLVHSLSSLADAIKPENTGDDGSQVVWATFYDIRRYGGLQIFLRAMFSSGSLVLSGADEELGDFLIRLGTHRVTKISGTPSHWRRVLMSPFAHEIAPRYVRLSGEIADQAILDNLRCFYPQARIDHAYASTEAGVAFEVTDGLEGFPANIVGASGAVELKIDDGSLRIRSPRVAGAYLNKEHLPVADIEGFVDTGDMVQLRGERYHFLGRRSGVINVGGLKVHPEEVEAVINHHPKVHVSLVRPKKNPIMGSIVVADVVLKEDLDSIDESCQRTVLKREILEICRERLAKYKVPATIHFVQSLNISATGKLIRHNA
jgi:acyl-CoA synthetase (AMP-forming)/AMP-acid ligase II